MASPVCSGSTRVGLLVLVFVFKISARDLVFLFYPGIEKPQVVKARLSKHLGIKTLEVFAQFRDFAGQTKKKSPSVILSFPETLEKALNYKTILRGKTRGKTKQDLFWVYHPNYPETWSGAPASLGVVDFLGRQKTQEWLEPVVHQMPRVKRVAKVEDLLPLLNLKIAKGVVLTTQQFRVVTSISHSRWILKKINGLSVGYLSVGSKHPEKTASLVSLLKGHVKAFKSFGIDAFEDAAE